MFVLVAVLYRTGALDGFDVRVSTFVIDHRRGVLTSIADALDKLDTWWLLAIIVAALLGGLWWSGRMVQAVYLGASIAAALIINPLLKLAFERPRPSGRRAGPHVEHGVPERPHDHGHRHRDRAWR